jgi:hypothetical protein
MSSTLEFLLYIVDPPPHIFIPCNFWNGLLTCAAHRVQPPAGVKRNHTCQPRHQWRYLSRRQTKDERRHSPFTSFLVLLRPSIGDWGNRRVVPPFGQQRACMWW